jgi:hypothetical protein
MCLHPSDSRGKERDLRGLALFLATYGGGMVVSCSPRAPRPVTLSSEVPRRQRCV